MNNKEILTIGSLGLAGGLLLGFYLWGSEEDKKKLSLPINKLTELLKNGKKKMD